MRGSFKDISGIRRRTWAEIDLDSAQYNFSLIRNAVCKNAKICCVIKANGYGHSAVVLGRLYESIGADFLAVSNIEEALQLRNNGILLPILILGYTPEECAEILSKNNISQCVYSYDYGKRLAKCAKDAQVKVNIHIKLDTGMNRIGFLCGQNRAELDSAAEVCRQDSLVPEGIFTHFAVADESDGGKDYTKRQYDRFTDAIDYLKEQGIEYKIRHCANSAAIFDYPEYHLDMVRAGIVLYGLKPSEKVQRLPNLVPIMTLKTIVSHIKTLEKGQTVSYGRAFTADKTTKVATVPIGYADGFYRANFMKPYSFKINGKSAPIIGRVCMDQLMLDVTDIDCNVGDIVTVFGKDVGNTADSIAAINSTINYEVVCQVGERVPRAIVENGKIITWCDSIYSVDL